MYRLYRIRMHISSDLVHISLCNCKVEEPHICGKLFERHFRPHGEIRTMHPVNEGMEKQC